MMEAFAQTETQATNQVGHPLGMFLPLILIFVVFYFLLIRPQQKRHKQHQLRLAKITRGTKIITGGGLIGIVHRVINDQELEVDLADNIRVKVIRSTVSRIIDEANDSADNESQAIKTDIHKTTKKNSA